MCIHLSAVYINLYEPENCAKQNFLGPVALCLEQVTVTSQYELNYA
jgi:hypothetical protein